MMTITLTGFMGSGKTSVGRALGALLGWKVVDVDEEIERRTGKSVPEIFSQSGEAGFRLVEKEVLADILADDADKVVSLGGGSLKDETNAALVKEKSTCIYLKASAGNLALWLEGAAEQSRPLLERNVGVSLEEHINALLAERGPLYEAVSDHTLDVDELSYGQAAERIRDLIR